MFTASQLHAYGSRARTLVIAGTLALASVLPSAALVYADSGTSSTPSASAPALTEADAFDVDPAGGVEDIQAVVVAPVTAVALMEEPAADADVVETLNDGTEVLLRIDMVDTVTTSDNTRWWPVSVGSSEGWIDGRSLMSPEDYAAYSSSAKDSTQETANQSSTTTSTRVPFDYTGELAGATAEVDADGDGLKMRAEPDAGADVIVSLSDGTIVDLRIADTDTVYDSAGTRWWPVSYDGNDGWVSGFYLITPGTAGQSGTATTPSTQVADSGDYTYVAGDWAVIRTSDQARTNLYSSASTDTDINGTAPHMALVEVVAQADGGWYEIRWDTVQGFVPGDLLTAGTAPVRTGDTDPAPTPTPAAVSTESAAAETEALAAGDIGLTNSEGDGSVNLRASASVDGDVVAQLDDQTRVEIVSGPSDDAEGNAWYEVKAGDDSGWIRADLLTKGISSSTETTGNASDTVSDAGFILPLASYRFTQDYGCSSLGFYSYDPDWDCAIHDGVDLATAQGTPILAVADATVVVAGWCDCGLGYYVELDHGDGVHTIYGHMVGQPSVSVGDTVTQGQEIGQVGSTGLSTGPHVHFMVRVDGVTQDPKNFLPPLTTSGS